ncbi:hypothetical protein IKF04_03220 [Candidatus Saccharibacteria bacterium]|nr:hypothetical protein [Candidatus Saccharibacteria bacterium]
MAEKSTGYSYSFELRQPNVTSEEIAERIKNLEGPVVVVFFDCDLLSGYYAIESIINSWAEFIISKEEKYPSPYQEEIIEKSFASKKSIVIHFKPSANYYPSDLNDTLKRLGAKTIIGVKMRCSGLESNSISWLYSKKFDWIISYDID